MVDMDKVTADIFKTISDLKKSGIIEELMRDSAAERRKKDESQPSSEAKRPDDPDASST